MKEIPLAPKAEDRSQMTDNRGWLVLRSFSEEGRTEDRGQSIGLSKEIFSALLRRAPVATSRRHGGQHDELGSRAAPSYQRI